MWSSFHRSFFCYSFTAWVGSGALAISCLLSPLVSLLCNRYGYRLVTIGGGLTCALGLILTAHAPSLPVIYVTYTIVFGFGASCAYTSAFIVVTDYFSKWRSLATGVTCAGSSCGMLIMIPVIQVNHYDLDHVGNILIGQANIMSSADWFNVNVNPCCAIYRNIGL